MRAPKTWLITDTHFNHDAMITTRKGGFYRCNQCKLDALEYAYENVLQEAKNALRGMRKPTLVAMLLLTWFVGVAAQGQIVGSGSSPQIEQGWMNSLSPYQTYTCGAYHDPEGYWVFDGCDMPKPPKPACPKADDHDDDVVSITVDKGVVQIVLRNGFHFSLGEHGYFHRDDIDLYGPIVDDGFGDPNHHDSYPTHIIHRKSEDYHDPDKWFQYCSSTAAGCPK